MTAPAWDTISTDIACPMCEYNLRGLESPRCPECGYAFEWEELLKAGTEHPTLFESCKRRRVRAYLKTFLLSVWPVLLWKRIRAVELINHRRLMIYWLVPWLVLATVLVALPVVLVVKDQFFPARVITSSGRWLPNGVTLTWSDIKAVPGNELAAFSRFWLANLFVMIWPWLTLLTLRIFSQTLYVARIRPDQLLRAVVYSDPAIVLVFTQLGSLILMVVGDDQSRLLFTILQPPTMWWSTYWINDSITVVYVIAFLVMPALCLFRLIVAATMYLRFRNAVAMMVLSQVMVWLAGWCLLLWQYGPIILNTR